jgi:hypothetical protein
MPFFRNECGTWLYDIGAFCKNAFVLHELWRFQAYSAGCQIEMVPFSLSLTFRVHERMQFSTIFSLIAL